MAGPPSPIVLAKFLFLLELSFHLSTNFLYLLGLLSFSCFSLNVEPVEQPPIFSLNSSFYRNLGMFFWRIAAKLLYLFNLRHFFVLASYSEDWREGLIPV